MQQINIGPYKLFYEDQETFDHTLCLGENYEQHVTVDLKERLRNAHGFMDVGSNVGIYTVLTKWWKGPDFPTVSVDVNPTNCRCLLTTIETNGFWNSLVLPAAASDCIGSVYGNNSWNTGLSEKRINDDWGFRYPCMPLDNVDFGMMDVIKIDVEGFELPAMRGLVRTIAAVRPTIFFEYNLHCMRVTGTDPICLLGFVLRMGYKLTVLDYKPGMRATFTDADECANHIARFGELCDIMAAPI